MPTRREASRPNRLPQKLEGTGGKIVVDLALDSHPAPLVFPLFATNVDGDDSPLRYHALRVAPRKGRLEELAARPSAGKWSIPCADPETFARFLAKVGYCFAVGSYGLENIRQHFVKPLIHTGGRAIGKWVSSAEPSSASDNDGAHHLTAEILDGNVLTRIRLFAISGSPEYTIIVGSV